MLKQKLFVGALILSIASPSLVPFANAMTPQDQQQEIETLQKHISETREQLKNASYENKDGKKVFTLTRTGQLVTGLTAIASFGMQLREGIEQNTKQIQNRIEARINRIENFSKGLEQQKKNLRNSGILEGTVQYRERQKHIAELEKELTRERRSLKAVIAIRSKEEHGRIEQAIRRVEEKIIKVQTANLQKIEMRISKLNESKKTAATANRIAEIDEAIAGLQTEKTVTQSTITTFKELSAYEKGGLRRMNRLARKDFITGLKTGATDFKSILNYKSPYFWTAASVIGFIAFTIADQMTDDTVELSEEQKEALEASLEEMEFRLEQYQQVLAAE